MLLGWPGDRVHIITDQSPVSCGITIYHASHILTHGGQQVLIIVTGVVENAMSNNNDGFFIKKKRNPKKQRPESPKVGRAAMDMTLGFQRRPALHQPRRLHLVGAGE